MRTLTSDPARDPANDLTAIRRWMQACIVAVFAAVMVGGITRLTDSGLSITEWRPIAGVLPPMSDGGWRMAYEAYLRIPQAQTTHAGITLEGFKVIYWWEWFHRLMARGVGLVFALPYLWLFLRGRIPRDLRLRLLALPLLTLAQGALGWYMVQSGLAERSSVSQYRLAAHLALALAILVVATWTWAELRTADDSGWTADPGGGDRDHSAVAAEIAAASRVRWRVAIGLLLAIVCLTIVTGAFVAGLDAGRIFNTFPLMEGAVVPEGYLAFASWWRNAFENPIAVQLHHRILALSTAAFALIAAWRVGASPLDPAAVKAVRDVGKAVLLQVALGVATLLLAVPVWAGVLHQFVGALVLGAATIALHAVKRAARAPSSG